MLKDFMKPFLVPCKLDKINTSEQVFTNKQSEALNATLSFLS